MEYRIVQRDDPDAFKLIEGLLSKDEPCENLYCWSG